MKRLLSLLLTLSFLGMTLHGAAASSDQLPELARCGKLFAYSGVNCAYFYGFGGSELISAQVLPHTVTRCCQTPGVIRAVCHDETCAYALTETTQHQFSVVTMHMDNGRTETSALRFEGQIQADSFAVSQGEVLIRIRGTAYSAVCGIRGTDRWRYEIPDGAKQLFINGGNAYVRSHTGSVFRLLQGTKTKCPCSVPNSFVNAGNGFLYTGEKTLLRLDGSEQRLNAPFAVKTGSGVFTYENSALAVAAAGDRAAVLTAGFVCTYHSFGEAPSTAAVQPSNNTEIGILTAGTTVPQLMKAYPAVTSVQNANGETVRTGAVRTGYVAVFANGTRTLAVAGDLNGSGTVNSADIKALMELFASQSSCDSCVKDAADSNRDGVLDNRDLVLLSRMKTE